MKQGIDKILDIVLLVTASDTSIHPVSSHTNLSILSSIIAQEVETIRQELVSSVFKMSRPADAEFLIQNHQAILITLLDEVHAFAVSISPVEDAHRTCDPIIESLSSLLFFIEKYFGQYFNIDGRVPEVYYLINMEQLRKRFCEMKNLLEEKGVSADLIKVLSLTLEETNTKKEVATYKQFIYLRELLNELVMVAGSTESSDFNVAVTSLLIYLNYNDPKFICWMISEIRKEQQSVASVEDKITALKVQKKQTNQIATRPLVGLHLDILSAKGQIVQWINEELNFLQSESDLSRVSMPTANLLIDSKITTSLSVPQLAFLIRILVEDKIITNNNQTEILKFFATNFTTVKRESVSYIHLRSQYYKPDSSSIESVKNILLKLINVCRKLNY